MTREEIREGIARISCRWCEHLAYCEQSCGVPEQDLTKLSELGVVIKLDRKLPSIWDSKGNVKSALVYREELADFKAIEPVIKESDV